MAKLRFFYGTMGSGKSTLALQIHHNLTHRGLDGQLLTQLDRRGAVVSSRLGVRADAIEVEPDTDLEKLGIERFPLDYLIADEAQFYSEDQVEQLANLVDQHEIDVWAFGLLTTFQGRLFSGTARFLELADETSEIQVEARCWCGQRATHNARLVDGVMVTEGEVKMVGDTNPASSQQRLGITEPEVTYELLCRKHWVVGQVGAHGQSGSPQTVNDVVGEDGGS